MILLTVEGQFSEEGGKGNNFIFVRVLVYKIH